MTKVQKEPVSCHYPRGLLFPFGEIGSFVALPPKLKANLIPG